MDHHDTPLMDRIGQIVEIAARWICAALLTGATLWVAGAAAGVSQAARAGELLTVPFVWCLAAYCLVLGLAGLAYLPWWAVRRAWRFHQTRGLWISPRGPAAARQACPHRSPVPGGGP